MNKTAIISALAAIGFSGSILFVFSGSGEKSKPKCVRAVSGCLFQSPRDGGLRQYGDGSVFPAAFAVGPNCRPEECPKEP